MDGEMGRGAWGGMMYTNLRYSRWAAGELRAGRPAGSGWVGAWQVGWGVCVIASSALPHRPGSS